MQSRKFSPRREQYEQTQQVLKQKRRELEASEAAVGDLRATALDQIRERAQHLLLNGTYVQGYKVKPPGAFPVDERGRPEITHATLLTLLGEPLRQLVRDALA